jgi:WD repeat-containing protein 35
MKTAMRLIEYEKELSTKEVYSIVAIACLFNTSYKECSKAFVKLERLEGLTKEE